MRFIPSLSKLELLLFVTAHKRPGKLLLAALAGYGSVYLAAKAMAQPAKKGQLGIEEYDESQS
jgi:hypothetical protein